MKRTIFLKVFGSFAVIVLLVGALIFGLAAGTLRRHYEEISARHLETLGRALQAEVDFFLDGEMVEDLQAYIRKMDPTLGARITVIDPQGTVLADSEKDPAAMENHRYRQEVSEALSGRVGQSRRFSYTVDARMLYVGIPLEKDGRIRAVLRLSYFMTSIDNLLGRLRGMIGRAVLGITLLALLAALALSLHVTRPIRALTRASEKIAGGEFRTRVHLRNRDEFRALGEGFNAMAERIESLFADVTSQKENLLNTIGAVTEGLAVLDREGKIVLANVSFKTLSGEPAVEGRFFWEVMRRPKLRELIDRVRAEKRGLSQECRLDDRSYLCNLGYLAFQDGIVLILHDLTELHKVEDIKRDFIVNASHELRTPLAAILGAAELLENESCDGARSEAMPILKRNAERLIGIVEDMLKLGELEDRSFKLDIQTVDAPSIASDILKIFEPRAKAKGLSLRLEAPAGIPPVALDPDLLERLLFNLIDNAVKYSDRGDISVRFRGEEGSLAIDVADTGPGIPPEHQARVFERFYVVDKSRSRRLGGTGLGLSIVKHIVQLHGGTVELRSTEGRGTTFTVRFPLRPAGSVQP